MSGTNVRETTQKSEERKKCVNHPERRELSVSKEKLCAEKENLSY